MNYIFKILLTWVILLLSSCQSNLSGSEILVKDAWVRPIEMVEIEPVDENQMQMNTQDHQTSNNTAAYMVLENSGDESDKLIFVECESAAATEIHISEMVGDVMKMRPVNQVEIPGKSTVEFKPGGLHIMLIGLEKNIKTGDKIQLLLEFAKFGQITVQAEVRNP